MLIQFAKSQFIIVEKHDSLMTSYSIFCLVKKVQAYTAF